MSAGMEIDRSPCHPDLQLPTQAEVVAAMAYSNQFFQRILCAWVQDLLERRRTTADQTQISQKRAA